MACPPTQSYIHSLWRKTHRKLSKRRTRAGLSVFFALAVSLSPPPPPVVSCLGHLLLAEQESAEAVVGEHSEVRLDRGLVGPHVARSSVHDDVVRALVVVVDSPVVFVVVVVVAVVVVVVLFMQQVQAYTSNIIRSEQENKERLKTLTTQSKLERTARGRAKMVTTRAAEWE